MKLTKRTAIGGAALALIVATAANAQLPSGPTLPGPQAESLATPQDKPTPSVSPARLEQMLAPIALYPDDLLAAIFIAATYPLDVVEATRWLQDPRNAVVRGDQLFAAMKQKSWDPSVKSLAPFAHVLRMLDANLGWTERLGEAYLTDPGAVMDAVQRLHRRAQSIGRLVTTPEENVRTEQERMPIEELITIEPASPEVVYVPICDPSFAYGPWTDPGYPPFFPVFPGAPIGGCDWISGPIVAPFWGLRVLNFRTRHIEIDHKRMALFDGDRERKMDRDHALEEWRHDPGHRGNVPYRDAAVSAMWERKDRGELQSCFTRTLGGVESMSRVHLWARRRKGGSVLRWNAQNYRLTTVVLGLRGSERLLKGSCADRPRPARLPKRPAVARGR